MKAIVVTDKAAGTAGMKLVERPEPQGASLASLSGANYGDVIVQVHASGFTGDELAWPSTWIDRLGRDRTPSIPGHELAGVATALSYGTTGLSVGQRVRRRLRRFPSCSRPATNHRCPCTVPRRRSRARQEFARHLGFEQPVAVLRKHRRHPNSINAASGRRSHRGRRVIVGNA